MSDINYGKYQTRRIYTDENVYKLEASEKLKGLEKLLANADVCEITKEDDKGDFNLEFD